MLIKSKKQYDSLKKVLMLLWDLSNQVEVAAELNDLYDPDYEECEDCGEVESDCSCKDEERRYGGREYDDGDSFED